MPKGVYQRTLRPVEDRFWEKVDLAGPWIPSRPDLGRCQLWTACKQKTGYGKMGIGGKTVLPHRWVWIKANGPIPDGIQIDHLCHTLNPECAEGSDCVHRACVNLLHLEAVTGFLNNFRGNSASSQNLRKVYCPQGHRYDDENTHYEADGSRKCLICRRAYDRRRRPVGTRAKADG